MSELYGKEQIQTLEGIEAIRLRPGMYIGSTTQDGLRQITLEIISNSVDEYLNGYCTEIKVLVENNDMITIGDNGRGIPFGKALDRTETLENIFTKLHTGAKFDSSGTSGYNTSGGMNGVGAKATNALSSFFSVSSFRDKKHAHMVFEEGVRKSFTVEKYDGSTTGTTISFIPDTKIFKEGIEVDYTWLRNQLRELSFLSPGLVFVFKYKDKESEIISSSRGILDYIEELNKQPAITSTFYADSTDDKIGVKIAMLYNESYSDTYKLYTNNIPNTGGTHLTGFRSALTQSVNEYARANKLLKDKDDNLTGDELKEGLVLVLSFIMPDPVFSGQTKDVLSSTEGRNSVQKIASAELKTWLAANPNDAKAIIEKALLARAAREKAKAAKDAVRGINTKKKKGLQFDSKLADCYSKNRKACEIYITEGDSASGGLKDARNNEFQAIMPVRGKILNTQKASLEKIQKNAEIMTMIDAFGLKVDEKTMKITYDPDELRYGKIIIMSDADIDGAHIKNLFYTFIWNFCPQLITDGYIYAGQPPLYKVTSGKTYKYLKDDAALEEYRKDNAGKNYIVNRFKGLGELDPEEAEETLMNPSGRIIRQITLDDAIKAEELFNNLMGGDITPRKEYIKEHSGEAKYNAE